MTLTCAEQTIGDALALELPEPRLGDPRRCARALLRSRLPPAQPSEASSTVPLSTSEPRRSERRRKRWQTLRASDVAPPSTKTHRRARCPPYFRRHLAAWIRMPRAVGITRWPAAFSRSVGARLAVAAPEIRTPNSGWRRARARGSCVPSCPPVQRSQSTASHRRDGLQPSLPSRAPPSARGF